MYLTHAYTGTLLICLPAISVQVSALTHTHTVISLLVSELVNPILFAENSP